MPWLALSGPLLSSYAQTGWENSPLAVHGAHFRQAVAGWVPWLLLINGGRGLSHECVEDSCKRTCVEFGAEHPTELGSVGKRLEIWARSWKLADRPNLNWTVSHYLALNQMSNIPPALWYINSFPELLYSIDKLSFVRRFYLFGGVCIPSIHAIGFLWDWGQGTQEGSSTM